MNESKGLVPTEPETTMLEAPDDDKAVIDGIRTWQHMRAENKSLRGQLQQSKDYINKLEAQLNEQASSLSILRTDCEFYKLMAIEAKTHIHIIQGHVNAAANQVKDLSQRGK